MCVRLFVWGIWAPRALLRAGRWSVCGGGEIRLMRFGDAPVMEVRSALMARRFCALGGERSWRIGIRVYSALMARRFLRARRGKFVADRDSRIFCAYGAPVLRARRGTFVADRDSRIFCAYGAPVFARFCERGVGGGRLCVSVGFAVMCEAYGFRGGWRLQALCCFGGCAAWACALLCARGCLCATLPACFRRYCACQAWCGAF